MGFHLAIDDPDAARDPAGRVHVGTNGSQVIFFGLWIAAYGLDRRPESRRARRWVRAFHLPGVGDAVPRLERASVAELRALVGHDDGSGASWCALDLDRFARRRDVTDPDLAVLAAFSDECQRNDRIGRLDTPDTARLARTWAGLLPQLEPSGWYDTMLAAAHVATTAAVAGLGLRGG